MDLLDFIDIEISYVDDKMESWRTVKPHPFAAFVLPPEPEDCSSGSMLILFETKEGKQGKRPCKGGNNRSGGRE